MKKNLFYTVIISISLLYACSDGNTPRAVSENFLKAWSKGDYDAAKMYGNEDSKKLLDMMNSFKKMVNDSIAKKELAFKITRDKIEGDKATVFYKEEGSNNESQLPLVKVDREWKVAISKESINGTEGSGIIDIGATSMDTTSTEQ